MVIGVCSSQLGSVRRALSGWTSATVPCCKFSVSLLPVQAVSADFICTHRKGLTAPRFYGVWQTLCRSECSQMKPFLLLAMLFIILQDSKPLGTVHTASLSCVLLISQCFVDTVGKWAFRPSLGPHGSSSGGREKKNSHPMVLNSLPRLHYCFRIA